MLLMRATAFLATVSFEFVYCLPFAACASSLSCLVFFNRLVSLYTLSLLSGLYGEAYQPPAVGFGLSGYRCVDVVSVAGHGLCSARCCLFH